MDQREFSKRGGRARMNSLSEAEKKALGRKGGIASGKAKRKKAREKKKAQKTQK